MLPWMWRCEVVVLALVLAMALTEFRPGVDEDFLPLQCPPLPANCAYLYKGSRESHFFDVAGYQIHIDFRDGVSFALTCDEPVKLENPELPRFKEAVRVIEVRFDKCTPPSKGSYAAVLVALNVTAFTVFKLERLPAKTVLTRQHLTGLQHLSTLELNGAARGNVSLAPGALSAATGPALRNLVLHTVRTPAADLAHLPLSLQTLKQHNVGVVNMSFNSLPNLITLDVGENYKLTINASHFNTLKVLYVSLPNNQLPEDAMPPNLTDLSLSGWNDTRPAPRTRCAQLRRLKLFGTNNLSWPVSLPEEWVASCGRLTDLELHWVPVDGMLPARVLAHAHSLQRLILQYCNLKVLPPGFLDGTPRLTTLDIRFNYLTTLPSGLFVHTQSLNTLDMSHNMLRSSVADTLSAASSLRTLRLNHNAQLGDLCDARVLSSALKSLTSLEYLHLSNTRVSRVCSDWRRELLHLRELHLENTHITVLNVSELQFRRAVPHATVYLKGRRFQLQYSREDYSTGASDMLDNTPTAKVEVDGKLVCDCNAYWTALELKRSPRLAAHVAFPKCNGIELGKVNVDKLTCDASEQCKSLALPTNCSCSKRDDIVHNKVVFVECAGAGLREPPRLPAAGHKWRLHLAHNKISNITAAHVANINDIAEYDLRNNSIETLDGEIAEKLASVPLLLGDNRLYCGCESFQTLNALLGSTSSLRDKVNVTCKYTDGEGLLVNAPLELCSVLTVWVVIALALLSMVAVAAAVALARSATLEHVKMFLAHMGWLPPRAEPADEDRRYDAFISYAHEDEELVVERLAPRLESGPRPYRLCLHYRDWAPGEWIPAQIAASVRASRRTVAVVSRAYLESGWARAEFRAATAASLRDGTRRLVVVLLEDPPHLPRQLLDPEIAAYLRNNTYVRWGDHWFWEKLKRALPPPRPGDREVFPPSPSSPDVPVERKCAPPVMERGTPCSA